MEICCIIVVGINVVIFEGFIVVGITVDDINIVVLVAVFGITVAFKDGAIVVTFKDETRVVFKLEGDVAFTEGADVTFTEGADVTFRAEIEVAFKEEADVAEVIVDKVVFVCDTNAVLTGIVVTPTTMVVTTGFIVVVIFVIIIVVDWTDKGAEVTFSLIVVNVIGVLFDVVFVAGLSVVVFDLRTIVVTFTLALVGGIVVVPFGATARGLVAVTLPLVTLLAISCVVELLGLHPSNAKKHLKL
uniref:Uncharacterized protein n=1 Tax=Rhabditophanes sp. KR3021 TaxID=114890 RepID=A0AC35U5H7_9BILA